MRRSILILYAFFFFFQPGSSQNECIFFEEDKLLHTYNKAIDISKFRISDTTIFVGPDNIFNIIKLSNPIDDSTTLSSNIDFCYTNNYLDIFEKFDDSTTISFLNDIYIGFYPLSVKEEELFFHFTSEKDTISLNLEYEQTPPIETKNDEPIETKDNFFVWIQKNKPWSFIGLLGLPFLIGGWLMYLIGGNSLRKKINKLGKEKEKLSETISLKASEIENQKQSIIDLTEDRDDKKAKLEGKIKTVKGLSSQIGSLQSDNIVLQRKLKKLESESFLLSSLTPISQKDNHVKALAKIIENAYIVISEIKTSLKKETASQKRFYDFFESFLDGNKQKERIQFIAKDLEANQEDFESQELKPFFDSVIRKRVWHMVSLFQRLSLLSKVEIDGELVENKLSDDLGLQLIGVKEIENQVNRYLNRFYQVRLIDVKLMKDEFNPDKHQPSDFNQLSFFGFGALISELPNNVIYDLIESGVSSSSVIGADIKPVISVKKA